MDHPGLLLVPVFMLLDYYLTLTGQVLNKKVYAKHFKTESYELNPNWQADVRRERWLNPRHLALVVVMTALFGAFVYLLDWLGADRRTVDMLLGLFLVLFGTIIGRHLNNITIFLILNRRPHLVSGEITLTQTLVLYLSVAQTFIVLVPFVTALVLAPSAFLAGGVLGIALIPLIHLRWLRAMKAIALTKGEETIGTGTDTPGDQSVD